VGTLVGEQAFYRLLSLKGGEFHVKPFRAPPQRTIQERWEFLLMEAARVCDEETVLIRKKPAEGTAKSSVAGPGPLANAPAGTPVPAETPPPKDLPPMPDEKPAGLGDDIVVVATYDGKWKSVDDSKK
jgi:hypothetical protein